MQARIVRRGAAWFNVEGVGGIKSGTRKGNAAYTIRVADELQRKECDSAKRRTPELE